MSLDNQTLITLANELREMQVTTIKACIETLIDRRQDFEDISSKDQRAFSTLAHIPYQALRLVIQGIVTTDTLYRLATEAGWHGLRNADRALTQGVMEVAAVETSTSDHIQGELKRARDEDPDKASEDFKRILGSLEGWLKRHGDTAPTIVKSYRERIDKVSEALNKASKGQRQGLKLAA